MLRCVLCIGALVAVAHSQLISLPMYRMKSPRQTMAEVGTEPKDFIRFLKPKPKPPRTNDSVALFKYLDGEFYGELSIGHPAQTFKVVYDTAWANTWVPSSQCSWFSPPCQIHNKYKSKASTTYVENGTSFLVNLGNKDAIKGFLSKDVFHVAHTNVENVTFAEIVNMPMSFIFNKADGVLGLGLSANAVDGVTPIFYTMVKEGLIAEPIFSIYMNRDFTTTRGGNLILGGSEPKHYNGSFTYLQVIDQNSWKIKMDRVELAIGNKTKAFCISGCGVILDTSTITISAPVKEANRINAILEATSEFMGRSKVPCNMVVKMPPITFVFAGKPFKLEPLDYIQKMNIMGMTVCLSSFMPIDGNDWIVGGAFISQYYTEFDLVKKRVGFATARW